MRMRASRLLVKRAARLAGAGVLSLVLGLAALELWLPGPLGMSIYVPYRALRNSVRDAVTASPPALASFSNAGPNVVIVVLDCFRSDYLEGAAPGLDELASRAWRFDRYYTAAAWTKPSTASLFTGLFVRKHMVASTSSPLPKQAVTLAEVLREHGYSTAGFTWHNPHISERQDFDQGFEQYFDDVRPRGSKGLLNRFLSWLVEEEPSRFFAYVHFEGTHDPYLADNDLGALLSAPGYASDIDFSNTDYKQEVKDGRSLSEDEMAYLESIARSKARKVDRQVVQELIERFESSDLVENTLLILTSDHGDAFYEHGTVSHGQSVFGEEIHVPLVVHFPERFTRERGFPRTGRDRCVASTVDLLPTVLDFVGVAAPRGIDGASIVPGSRSPDACSRVAVSEMIEDGRIPEAAIISGPWKLIVDYDTGTRKLYDLAADPGELRDLAAERVSEADALAAALARRLNADGSSMAEWGETAPVEVSGEERERLRALGYAE